jgi:2-iminoacetate synthase ThiH
VQPRAGRGLEEAGGGRGLLSHLLLATPCRVNGDVVSFVVNRNINYTNVCTYACQFCAFSKVWLARRDLSWGRQ